MELGERKKLILSAIVNLYIATGEPVGSKLLVSTSGLNLSSATLRNEMSELVEYGYLEQPHTSAGRVPSQMGYRIYVDCLMGQYALTPDEKQNIEKLLKIRAADLESLLEKAGILLANLTGCASVSAMQQSDGQKVQRIEIVQASRRSVLVVLLVSSGLIKSRVCKAGEDVSATMTVFFMGLLNEKIAGKQLNEITAALKEEIKSELYEYTYALGPVLDIIFEELDNLTNSEVILGGETNLLSHSSFYGEQAVDIIRFLEEKSDLKWLTDGMCEGIKVRIGSEIGPVFMQSSSVIAAPYEVGGNPTGAIGIIGPTRMNYPRLMSHIQYFSNILSKLISDTFYD